jgi:hypothetical protein
LVADEWLVIVMSNLKRRIAPVLFSSAAALAFLVVPSAVTAATDHSAPVAQPCYNGVTLLNPYARSCTIPGPVNRIRGSAPDANAIIACKGIPGCLAYYVNPPF